LESLEHELKDTNWGLGSADLFILLQLTGEVHWPLQQIFPPLQWRSLAQALSVLNCGIGSADLFSVDFPSTLRAIIITHSRANVIFILVGVAKALQYVLL